MRRERKQPEQSSGPKVPAYIVTFSDMVTLLLTFFVMLLTLAQVQDPELFFVTRDAFITRINTYGLGVLDGKEMVAELGANKIKYHISNPDKDPPGRTIDAKEEEIRRIYKRISQSMVTMPSQIVARETNFTVTNICFAAGQASLNESAENFLEKFSTDLQVQTAGQSIKLYVLGLANDVAGDKDQWILSAKRAKAAADFLKSTFNSQRSFPVFCMGAGPGGQWVTSDSPVSEKSQILIGVLRD